MTTNPEPRTCNRCGETCALGGWNGYGLSATVSGGYESTPGNGDGALDDGSAYSFSLCEFCLDWLFGTFAVPVTVTCNIDGKVDPWRPAAQRVREDEWRRDKESFPRESARREALHSARGPWPRRTKAPAPKGEGE